MLTLSLARFRRRRHGVRYLITAWWPEFRRGEVENKVTEDEHPLSLERLVAHAFNELDEGGGAAISAHVATCLACAVSVARLQRLRDHLHRDNLLVPPLATLSRARAIFQQGRPAQRGWLPSVIKYAASGQARLAFGLCCWPFP